MRRRRRPIVARRDYGPWHVYARRVQDDQYEVFRYGEGPEAAPVRTPSGGRALLSADECWLEVHDKEGRVVASYVRSPV